MKSEIFYFSGTGNSLHVARELQKRIPNTVLVPIVSVLNSGKIKTEADTVGIVFPIHAFSTPLIVKQFLQQIDLKSAKYLFAVTTRTCSDKVFTDMNKIIAKQNKSFNACFAVEMPETYYYHIQLPEEEYIHLIHIPFQAGFSRSIDNPNDYLE